MPPIDILSNVALRNTGPRPFQTQTAWGYKPPVGNSDDLIRIAALPRREQELDGTERAEAIIDMITERYAKKTKSCSCKQLDPDRECVTRLRLVQAIALREISICGGLLGPIGVGHGKTLIDLLAPLAFADHGIKTSILLVPPGLITQLIGDYEFVGQHFRMPSIVFHGNSFSAIVSGSPVVHVVPYSRLSRPEATTWMESRLKPEAIIADEVHKLRNVKTATGHRVDAWMEAHPKTLFAGWSGSVTAKKLTDYDHLARWALRGGSPMPLDNNVTIDLGRAIGSKAQENPADGGPWLQLCVPGETLECGFRRRLAQTLGVVTTTSPPIDVALEIDAKEAPPIPDDIMAALNSVRDFVRPDGEELMDALAVGAAARQVACGFYYKWIFPKHVFPRDEAMIADWREYRKLYHKAVRAHLKHNAAEHLDSPKLCQNAAERGWGDRPQHRGLPAWKCPDWPAWRDIKHRVQYESEPVRINDFLVRDAIEWATENRGIVWYEHGAFGEWMAELSEQLGCPLPMYGGGKNGGGLLGERGNVLERGDRSLILSIKAHGTGRNGLQNIFCDQLIIMLPSGDGCEQVLGRLHRIGQKAPSVRALFYKHSMEMAKHVNEALRDALYVEGTLGAVQKLRMGFKVEVREEDSE